MCSTKSTGRTGSVNERHSRQESRCNDNGYELLMPTSQTDYAKRRRYVVQSNEHNNAGPNEQKAMKLTT
jgi:hypothetical protein